MGNSDSRALSITGWISIYGCRCRGVVSVHLTLAHERGRRATAATSPRMNAARPGTPKRVAGTWDLIYLFQNLPDNNRRVNIKMSYPS